MRIVAPLNDFIAFHCDNAGAGERNQTTGPGSFKLETNFCVFGSGAFSSFASCLKTLSRRLLVEVLAKRPLTDLLSRDHVSQSPGLAEDCLDWNDRVGRGEL